MGIVVDIGVLWRDWEGGFVWGGRNGCLCSESGGRNGSAWLAEFGIGRVILSGEGGTVCGGCCCHAFFLVVVVGVTLAPSGDGIALPVWWRRLDFEGFARIGRVVLSVEGENVAKAVVVG